MIRIPGQKLTVPVTFPAVLSRSRDYNAVEMLLQTIFGYFYTLSKESKNVHNPRRCSAELLPLLADYYRYEYTDVKDIAMEREIMATVPELHHNKGCVVGIDNALALSIIDKSNPVVIPWFYTKDTNTITVISLTGVKTYKMLELLKLVIPLGTKVDIKPGFAVYSSEEIKMHSWTEVHFGALDPNRQWYITQNNVWYTEWDPEKQLYHTYVDYQRNIGSDGMETKTGISENTAGTRIGNTEVAKNETKVPDEKGEEE